MSPLENEKKRLCNSICLLSLFGLFVFILAGGVFLKNAVAESNPSEEQIQQRRQELRNRLDKIEADINKQQQLLKEKKKEKVSLERDISILEAEIEQAKLEIRRRNIVIDRLEDQIGEKQAKVNELENKLGVQKRAVAELIRKINKIDDYSLIEILLREEGFSDFFRRLDAFKTVNDALKETIGEMRDLRKRTQQKKQDLIKDKEEEMELRKVQVLQKQKIERKEQRKKELLRAAKNKEREYRQIIEQKQKTAAEIRNELFTLRDSAPIPFEKALRFARQASDETGVRPAFILGILAEESNIGEYMGTGTWREDMKPSRDKPVFKAMAREIGFDPDEMPVSAAPSYGWGGAMGPAQFIPSTWVCYGGLINTRTNDCNNESRSLSWEEFWQGPWEYRASEDKVRKLIGGDDPSNPWDPEDAIMASALLLSQNGADKGTRAAEKKAALRYFAGWANADDPSYAFYGDEVMELTKKYQKQIDILESSE